MLTARIIRRNVEVSNYHWYGVELTAGQVPPIHDSTVLYARTYQ